MAPFFKQFSSLGQKPMNIIFFSVVRRKLAISKIRIFLQIVFEKILLTKSQIVASMQ